MRHHCMILMAVAAFLSCGCTNSKTEAPTEKPKTGVRDTLKANQKADTLAADTAEQRKDIYELKEIKEEWQKLTIHVEDTTGKPDVVTMLRAFHNIWPTLVVREVLLHEDDSKAFAEKKYQDFDVTVDRQADYVSASGGDMEEMGACLWRKKSGHSLFAVKLGWPTAMVNEFMCLYDYNPEDKTLTPEKDPTTGYQAVYSKDAPTYVLPQRGGPLILEEYVNVALQHRYLFNGSSLVPAGIVLDGMDQMVKLYRADDTTDAHVRLTKFAFVDVDVDGQPELWLRGDGNNDGALFAFYFGEPKLIAVETTKRKIALYKGTVVAGGPAGGPSFFTQYIKLNNSQVAHTLNCMNIEGNKTFSLDGEEITAEDGERQQADMVEIPLNEKLIWTKMANPK